jgi:uncharacterized membrane protein YadS
MSDMNFGLWAGTAVNDTSSVVAAGYAYSDAAGQFATIVKLTRTLSIVPIVVIFSWVSQHKTKAAAAKLAGTENAKHGSVDIGKINISKIFPWFILLFLGMVALRTILDFVSAGSSGIWLTSTNIAGAAEKLASISKFAMVMALGAIGLNTDFAKLARSGFKPMLHGFIISAAVVIVSFLVQAMLGQV